MNVTSRFDEIAVFVHVVEAGSFTAAAGQRGVPKSTLSRAVARLEEAMRTPLLRRSSRKVALTEAGRALYDRTAPHVARLREAAETLDHDGEPQGTLRITAAPAFGDAFLGELLVRFTARYPRIKVEIDISTRKLKLVEEGFDVGLRASARIDDDSLVARRFATSELRLFSSRAYVARRGAPTTLEELVEHDVVLFRPVKGRSRISLVGPGGEQRTITLPGRISGGDYPFVRAALAAGAGIGLLPTIVGEPRVADGTLVRVLPAWSRASASLFIVYPAGRHVPSKVIAFRDFVLETFGAPGVRPPREGALSRGTGAGGSATDDTRRG